MRVRNAHFLYFYLFLLLCNWSISVLIFLLLDTIFLRYLWFLATSKIMFCEAMWIHEILWISLYWSANSAVLHYSAVQCVGYSVFRVDSSGANRARAAAYVLSTALDSQSPSFQFYCSKPLVFVYLCVYLYLYVLSPSLVFEFWILLQQASALNTYLYPEAEKPKTFQTAAFYAQKFFGRSA